MSWVNEEKAYELGFSGELPGRSGHDNSLGMGFLKEVPTCYAPSSGC